MQTKIFNTKDFYYDGRGPILTNWLYTQDLRLPGPKKKTDKSPGLICGAEYGFGWVVFYEMQVIQIVPEEVHSYWHRGYFNEKGDEETGVWLIEDSEWLKSFHPRHLNGYKHFIVSQIKETKKDRRKREGRCKIGQNF